MVRLKLGVIIAGLDPIGDILRPAIEAHAIWNEQKWGDVWITGGIDGNHSSEPLSGHYKGRSLDLRLPVDPAHAVVLLQAELQDWKIILEEDHIHCQHKIIQ